MKKLAKKFSKSIRHKLFISFLALTLLMSVLISMSAYFISFGIIKERVSSSFSLTLDYVRNSVNSELKQIHSLTDYIFVNQVIKDAINASTQKTAEAISLNNQANDIIKQYAISHIFENINSITIYGFNGYYLNYALSYADLVPDYIKIDDDNWKKLITESNGKIVWLGLTSIPLNKNQKNSVIISDILLIRSIKSDDYSKDIGLMCISVNPRSFTKLVKTYDTKYPAFSEKSRIYIMDNRGNILNSSDSSLDNDQLSAILNSKESYQPEGYTEKSQNYIAFVRSASELGWKVIGTIPLSSVMVDNTYIFFISVIAFILSIIVCTLIWFYVSSGIFNPLKKLANTMKEIENGNTALRVDVNTEDEIGSLGRNFNSMLGRMEDLHTQNLEKEIKIKDAEYRALQAQINPHFLYNTLNSIRWMAIMIQADNIKKAIDAFWSITKYSTDNSERFITVEKEIDIVKQYISLQKITYKNKFDVVWNVDESILTCECIKFFLQPIIENSILHGILPRKGTGMIYISIYPEEDSLVFNIYDDGEGMSPETISAITDPSHIGPDKKKVGLSNVIERNNHAYGDRFRIIITSEQGHYTNIMMRVPIIRS
jgi:Predicted signal transduction protein with a C-terminal ATPase domain